jgi:2-oxoglutarate dehydrogenase E1 component
MAADNNLRVANCTTAANYFHLLRRQALLLEVDPLPLIVMTPKSLLRHPLVASPLAQFSEPGWQPVIDRHPLPVKEGRAAPELLPAEEVRRLVICSGKVYIDLVTSDLAADHAETGVVRLEQLAPFPATAFREMLEGYPALDELVWVQEEPENMGAWLYVRPHLIQAVSDMGEKDGQTPALRYAARPRSSSPAEGSHNLHEYNQDNLVEEAYGEHREEPADETRNGKSTADSSRKSAVQRTAR